MLPSHLQGLQSALAVGLIVLTTKAGKRLSFLFEKSYFYLDFFYSVAHLSCANFEGSVVLASHEGYFN